MKPKVPTGYETLEYLRPLAWEEIFATWKKGEAWQESWRKHWQERGWDSWDKWRQAYAAPLHPEILSWHLYRIGNPVKELPNFYGVPSHAWVEKVYDGAKTKPLRDLVHLPQVQNNPKVLDIKRDFPRETMLTGVVFQNKIVLYEGAHRSLAIASWDPATPFTATVTLALAEWPESDIPRVGNNYKR